MASSLTHADLVTLEKIFRKYAEDFSAANPAAKVLCRGLSLVGTGILPVLDHFIFRAINPKERVLEFRDLGYAHDPATRVFSARKHSIEVYRRKGFPAVLIKEAHDPAAQEWVKTFGDKAPYVMAVRVDNLEDAELNLEKQAVGFLRPSGGKVGEELREIACHPSFQDGKIINVLVLVERHAANTDFYAPDFWAKA